ncbi:MAG: phosphatase PAP2 family protein [Pseudorhodoplanes sp.]|nr:phosphatase PAP2 family protein [Pseudorhodoplanes sp.]
MSGLDRLKQTATETGADFSRRFRASFDAGIAWLKRRRRPSAPPLLSRTEREQGLACVLFALALACASALFVDVPAVGWAKALPEWFVIAINRWTDFGRSSYVLWPLGVLLLICIAVGAMRLPAIQHRVLAAVSVRVQFLFMAVALPGLFATLVKYLVGRARPLAPAVPDALLFSPFGGGHGFSATPSGHAVTAFSLLVAAGAMWPRAIPFLLVYAFSIALSRVVVIAHFTSDVIVGALIGVCGAYLVRSAYAARGLVFHYDGRGRVVPKPGPSLRRLASLERHIFEKH